MFKLNGANMEYRSDPADVSQPKKNISTKVRFCRCGTRLNYYRGKKAKLCFSCEQIEKMK